MLKSRMNTKIRAILAGARMNNTLSDSEIDTVAETWFWKSALLWTVFMGGLMVWHWYADLQMLLLPRTDGGSVTALSEASLYRWNVFHTAAGAVMWVLGMVGLVWVRRQLWRYLAAYHYAAQVSQDREECYRAMFEDNRAMKLLIDPHSGYIVEANSAACDLYQYTRQELTSLRIWDLNLLGEAEARDQMRRSAVDKKTAFECRHRLRSGDVRDVQIFSGRVGAGGLNFLYSIVIDITERKQAEQRLRQSEEKFAKIFQATPDAVMISRMADGFLLEVNPGFEAITGYSRQEALGRSTLDLRLWLSAAERERLVRDVVLFGQLLYRFFKFRRKDTLIRIAQLSARPLLIDGETCLLLVMQDVTERQRVEDELRTSEERLRGIANNIPGVVYQFYSMPALTAKEAFFT